MIDFPWLSHYDPAVPKTILYPDIPLYHFLTNSAERFPNRSCMICQGKITTYKDAEILSNRLAAWLVRLGIRKGDRVGLVLPNISQFVLAFYAILKAGGVVVAINPQYTQREMEFQLVDSGVSLIIGLNSLYPIFKVIQPHTHVHRIILTSIEGGIYQEGSGGIEIGPGDLWMEELLQESPTTNFHDREIHGEDEAIFQYSGGTTGIPKAAIGLHRNLAANTLQFSHWLSGLVEGEEVVLTAIPLYHVYGMVIAMSMGIQLGATLVLIPDPRNIHDVLEQIQTNQATLFPGVPNMYQALNQHPEVMAGHFNLRSIKACISGSAPLLPEVKRKFEALTGGKLIEGYGLSEAPTATHCNPMMGENRVGSIGLPLPDVEAKIVDLDDGTTILAPGQVGELIIKGPQVMKGYYNLPDFDENTLKNGWLFTGDIAMMDSDGYFYLVDRKKEMIKIGGFQVWPREVEEVIALHPAVQEVGVAGVPDAEKEEIVKAWVVPRPGHIVTPEEIRMWCEEHLARYKLPSQIEFIAALPRTSVGKLLRRELVRWHIEQIPPQNQV